MKKINSKGFTLIEIIVVLLISSIAMVIAGSLILNSMGFFNKAAVTDTDKRAADGIASYIYDELIYASDVRVLPNDEKPEDLDGWHWFSIDGNHKLLRNGEKVFSDSYYNGENLEITARGFDLYRLDIGVSLLDGDKEVYKTKSSLELLNLKKRNEKEKYTPFLSTNTIYLSKDTTNAIYYKKGTVYIENDDDQESDDSGTVADEIKCKNSDNDKGVWKSGENYAIGDFVRWEIVSENGKKEWCWFRATQAMPTGQYEPYTPGINWWKKIDKKYNSQSQYYYGDIIIFNDLYYQVDIDPGVGGVIYSPVDDTLHWSEGFMTIEELKNSPKYIMPSCTLGNQIEDPKIYTGTVADEIHCKNIDNDKGWYNSLTPEKFKIGDFVQTTMNYTGTTKIYWYRLLKAGAAGSQPPTGGVWKRINMQWDKDSVYQIDDIVYYQNSYYKVIGVNESGTILVPPGIVNPDRPEEQWEKIDAPVTDTPPTCKTY